MAHNPLVAILKNQNARESAHYRISYTTFKTGHSFFFISLTLQHVVPDLDRDIPSERPALTGTLGDIDLLAGVAVEDDVALGGDRGVAATVVLADNAAFVLEAGAPVEGQGVDRCGGGGDQEGGGGGEEEGEGCEDECGLHDFYNCC